MEVKSELAWAELEVVQSDWDTMIYSVEGDPKDRKIKRSQMMEILFEWWLYLEGYDDSS